MKGIILAGGSGTRLYPITIPTIKQLLPIYDKPMIYYPLSTLMHAGIRDILIISTEKDLPRFVDLFGDGSHLGLNFSYKVQKEPKGLAEAFVIGEEFLNNDDACLVLGDNIFFGHGMPELLKKQKENLNGGTIFGYYVSDPKRYGVVEFDKEWKVISVEEKPTQPKSNYAVTGLYFFDKDVVEIAKQVKPSSRGELEIVSVINEYLNQERLNVQLMGRGFAWLDTGTYESLLDASNFVSILEQRQGLKVACIEEIAYRLKYINKEQLEKLAQPLKKTSYGDYLLSILEESNIGIY